MYTLLTISTLYAIIGWTIRYYKSLKDSNYSYDPTKVAPNILSITLVVCTIVSTIGIIVIISLKCP